MIYKKSLNMHQLFTSFLVNLFLIFFDLSLNYSLAPFVNRDRYERKEEAIDPKSVFFLVS